jgi:glutamate/tyrosine decarboxylase-like PLP-dependent enzyme
VELRVGNQTVISSIFPLPEVPLEIIRGDYVSPVFIMRNKLIDLEKTSRLLEPGAGNREEIRSRVVAYSENFLENIENIKAYDRIGETGMGILDSPVSETGIGIDEALDILAENVDTVGLNPASGGHLGYIPGGGIYYSALGDYLADVFNRYAGIFYASPGAVRMENMLIRWMNGIVGYPSDAAGNLTSGGSLANLIAIVTARDACGIRSANMTRSVIYLSRQTHHSIDKAIRIAGLGECIVRFLPLDERYRIVASALAEQIENDRSEGLNPFLVVASAGSTDVGAIDPLADIGDIAKREGLWYHIDAAYGGFFILTGEGKEKLKGIETSDSLAIDPHKGLFLPYGLGVVLVKNAEKLHESHRYAASYMQDAATLTDEASPADLSPELTKHFRGLRLWLPLKLHGVAPFRACLEEKLLLAKYFHAEVKKLGFESKIDPELSVVTYRWLPETGDANIFNKRLLEMVVADGRVFISSTMLNGEFTLRFACLAFRTHLSTVDTLLVVLREQIRGIG